MLGDIWLENESLGHRRFLNQSHGARGLRHFQARLQFRPCRQIVTLSFPPRMPASVMASGPAPGVNRIASPEIFWVGLELSPLVIRAGVYDSTLRCQGKIKLSAKLERGPGAVIGRITRCVQYAADECDLDMEHIRGIGLAIPGEVEKSSGRIISSTALGWSDVSIVEELEAALRAPVTAANNHQLAALGILALEVPEPPRTFAALFPGPCIGGALIASEDGMEFSPTPSRANAENIFHVMPGEEFRHYRGKDFKRALRKGDKAVEEYIRAVALRTGEIARRLIDTHHPEVLAIGGGAMEEMRDELMGLIQRTAEAEGGRSPVRWLASQLGDHAPLAGGAALAARSFGVAQLATR